MAILSRKHIESKAEGLTEAIGHNVIPVPVDVIAYAYGVELKPFEDLGDGVSGLLIVNDGEPLIGYNQNESGVRQRFTIAHELGHLFLHNKGVVDGVYVDRNAEYKIEFRNEVSSSGEVEKERDANAFAAALLMPKKLLLEEISQHHLNLADDDSLGVLAKKFNVSVSAMAYRLLNLGLGKSR